MFIISQTYLWLGSDEKLQVQQFLVKLLDYSLLLFEGLLIVLVVTLAVVHQPDGPGVALLD